MQPQPEERFERIERQIEFLVGQQGQTFAQIGQLGDYLLRTVRFVEDFARRTEERFLQLAEAQLHTQEELKQLAKTQQRTDERLNVLINVVERYFSDGRGQ